MQLQANQLREGDVMWLHEAGRRERVRAVYGTQAGLVRVVLDGVGMWREFLPAELVTVTLVA